MKKYAFSIIFILSSLIIILLPKDIISKKYEIEYEIIDSKEYTYIYYVDSDKLIGIPVEINKDRFQLIEMVFKFLTEKSNSVLYSTNLNLNSKLLSYELRGSSIYLEVSDSFLDIKEEETLLAMSQILYSYKELGYKEVYLLNKGEIIKQLNDVILYNGLIELPVNLLSNTTSTNSKIVKITYHYKNNTKSFVNYIVDFSLDELTFTLDKLIEFINIEYQSNLKLIEFQKNSYNMTIRISCNESDIKIIKHMIKDNLSDSEENIIIIVE